MSGSVVRWIPDWVVAVAVTVLIAAVCLLMAWFFRGAIANASESGGQQITCNLETVAGVYVWADGTVHPWANEPFTVEVVGGTLTLVPFI
jgi:hypothetical protein